MIRCFVAFDLDAAVRRRLADMQARLRAALAREAVRWVRTEGIHLTLKFLGDRTQEQVEDIRRTLADWAAEGAPLDLEVVGAGAFPDLRRPRVLWAGVKDDTNRLAGWVHRLEADLAKLDVRPEDRPFSPHLTLARLRDPLSAPSLGALRTAVEGLSQEPSVGMTALSVGLFRSELRPSGAVYTILANETLGRGENP